MQNKDSGKPDCETSIRSKENSNISKLENSKSKSLQDGGQSKVASVRCNADYNSKSTSCGFKENVNVSRLENCKSQDSSQPHVPTLPTNKQNKDCGKSGCEIRIRKENVCNQQNSQPPVSDVRCNVDNTSKPASSGREPNASVLSILEAMLPRSTAASSGINQLTVGKSEPSVNIKRHKVNDLMLCDIQYDDDIKSALRLCSSKKGPCDKCNVINTMVATKVEACQSCVDKKRNIFQKCCSMKTCKNCTCAIENNECENCKNRDKSCTENDINASIIKSIDAFLAKANLSPPCPFNEERYEDPCSCPVLIEPDPFADSSINNGRSMQSLDCFGNVPCGKTSKESIKKTNRDICGILLKQDNYCMNAQPRETDEGNVDAVLPISISVKDTTTSMSGTISSTSVAVSVAIGDDISKKSHSKSSKSIQNSDVVADFNIKVDSKHQQISKSSVKSQTDITLKNASFLRGSIDKSQGSGSNEQVQCDKFNLSNHHAEVSLVSVLSADNCRTCRDCKSGSRHPSCLKTSKPSSKCECDVIEQTVQFCNGEDVNQSNKNAPCSTSKGYSRKPHVSMQDDSRNVKESIQVSINAPPYLDSSRRLCECTPDQSRPNSSLEECEKFLENNNIDELDYGSTNISVKVPMMYDNVDTGHATNKPTKTADASNNVIELKFQNGNRTNLNTDVRYYNKNFESRIVAGNNANSPRFDPRFHSTGQGFDQNIGKSSDSGNRGYASLNSDTNGPCSCDDINLTRSQRQIPNLDETRPRFVEDNTASSPRFDPSNFNSKRQKLDRNVGKFLTSDSGNRGNASLNSERKQTDINDSCSCDDINLTQDSNKPQSNARKSTGVGSTSIGVMVNTGVNCNLPVNTSYLRLTHESVNQPRSDKSVGPCSNADPNNFSQRNFGRRSNVENVGRSYRNQCTNNYGYTTSNNVAHRPNNENYRANTNKYYESYNPTTPVTTRRCNNYLEPDLSSSHSDTFSENEVDVNTYYSKTSNSNRTSPVKMRPQCYAMNDNYSECSKTLRKGNLQFQIPEPEESIIIGNRNLPTQLNNCRGPSPKNCLVNDYDTQYQCRNTNDPIVIEYSSDDESEISETETSNFNVPMKIDSLIGNILLPANARSHNWDNLPVRDHPGRGNDNQRDNSQPYRSINIVKTVQEEYQYPNGRKVLKTEITSEPQTLINGQRFDVLGDEHVAYGNFSGIDRMTPTRPTYYNQRMTSFNPLIANNNALPPPQNGNMCNGPSAIEDSRMRTLPSYQSYYYPRNPAMNPPNTTTTDKYGNVTKSIYKRKP